MWPVELMEKTGEPVLAALSAWHNGFGPIWRVGWGHPTAAMGLIGHSLTTRDAAHGFWREWSQKKTGASDETPD